MHDWCPHADGKSASDRMFRRSTRELGAGFQRTCLWAGRAGLVRGALFWNLYLNLFVTFAAADPHNTPFLPRAQRRTYSTQIPESPG